jgi:hypothetical protein
VGSASRDRYRRYRGQHRPGLLHREFSRVWQIATFWNGLGVSDDEQGTRIYLATGLRFSWSRVWPAFRSYS